jgi:hypothetical protein
MLSKAGKLSSSAPSDESGLLSMSGNAESKDLEEALQNERVSLVSHLLFFSPIFIIVDIFCRKRVKSCKKL